MRLWHYKLIKFLPRQQLLAQWRELNSIFAKEDKHILINYVYEYDKEDLCAYTNLIIDEIEKRNYKVNIERFENYMQKDIVDNDCWANVRSCKLYYVFTNHHNEEYLKICCWNLYEKYIRGQEGFTDEAIKFIKNTIGIK